MKLYADPITINCRKVIAGLDFIGAPFELVPAALADAARGATPLLEKNLGG